MRKTVSIGIDNGVTGTIGIITPDSVHFFSTPTYKTIAPIKSRVRFANHVDPDLLEAALRPYQETGMVFLERPFTGANLMTTASAARADEATRITLRRLGMAYDYIDSKQWQGVLLPKGARGSAVLKAASAELGSRLYPQFSDLIRRHKDADGLLIAKWGLTQL